MSRYCQAPYFVLIASHRQIELACKDHSELRKRNQQNSLEKRDAWEYEGGGAEDGFSWKFRWDDWGDCKFSCKGVFGAIGRNESCEFRKRLPVVPFSDRVN